MKKIPIILLTVVATLITPRVFASNRILSLDGDGDYVEMADSEILNDIGSQVTMEIWIRPEEYPGHIWIALIHKTDESAPNWSNRSYALQLHGSGFIELASAPEGQGQFSLNSPGGLIALDNWYHIAGVVDAKNDLMNIFINGVEVARQNSGRNIHISKLPLRIGDSHEGSPNQYPFQGQIDEVRIWNVARTQEEIQATMFSGLSGREPGLVGYWTFDDVEDTITDLSPSGAHGKLMGDAHLAEAEMPKPGELVIPTVISGLITNESGIPVQRASVRLEQNGEEIAQARTDRNGSYLIAISRPVGDLYDLSATSGELGDWRYDIRLREGEQRIDLTLKEAISIEGTIMMLDDTTPHVAVPVQAIVGEKVIDGVLTDGDGRYRLINLRSGQYNVRCYIPGRYVYYEGEKAGRRGSECMVIY
jgi:hypothetical protein